MTRLQRLIERVFHFKARRELRRLRRESDFTITVHCDTSEAVRELEKLRREFERVLKPRDRVTPC